MQWEQPGDVGSTIFALDKHVEGTLHIGVRQCWGRHRSEIYTPLSFYPSVVNAMEEPLAGDMKACLSKKGSDLILKRCAGRQQLVLPGFVIFGHPTTLRCLAHCMSP